jgi:O-antigen/teichoic acid export membrane protein
MIEAILGEAPAGQYGVAYRIFEALNLIIAVVVIAALYPRLSRLRDERNEREFSLVMVRGQMGLAGVSILAAGSIAVAAPLIIDLLAGGADYEPSVSALRILVWAFPLLCANSLLYSALLALEDERFTACIVGGAVVLNVGLNFVMIPAFGINGAAVATIVPEALIIGIYALRYRPLRRQAFA